MVHKLNNYQSNKLKLNLNNNNNNNKFFYLQVAKSPNRLRFQANLPRARSQLYKAQSGPDKSN